MLATPAGETAAPFVLIFTAAAGLIPHTLNGNIVWLPGIAMTVGGIAGAQYDPCYHIACDTFAGTGSGPGSTLSTPLRADIARASFPASGT